MLLAVPLLLATLGAAAPIGESADIMRMHSNRSQGKAEETTAVVAAADAAAAPAASDDGRAPSCGGCVRRESMLSQTMRLHTYEQFVKAVGPVNAIVGSLALVLVLMICVRLLIPTELLITLFYSLLYLIASPTAILVNKLLMKDLGFGYPIVVSGLGQLTTMICATAIVKVRGDSTEAGKRVGLKSLMLLGGASALALVLGQYPYLYLTVAFIQMLKAFSPAYMVIFLLCLGVETPSRKVVMCVLGLSVCTAVASAGEVNFNIIGVLFMAAASCSDALRLVIAQKLLKNEKMAPMETLYYTSPVCLLWMVPAALITEVPRIVSHNSLALVPKHPMMFVASGFSGFFVNMTSFLLVKRTSSMTLKALTMARNGGLVLFSALLMGETITGLESFGYTGLLVCFTLYTIAKAQEAAQPKPDIGKEGPSVVVPLMSAGAKSHPSPPTSLFKQEGNPASASTTSLTSISPPASEDSASVVSIPDRRC